MESRFFSLIIVPDSGEEVKTSSFTNRFVLGVFSVLIVGFLVCVFFIVGYHVKLSQENEYKSVVSTMQKFLEDIDISRELLNTLTGKIREIHKNDQAYRLLALMNVIPDEDMYRAGIGGHVLVDDSDFSYFSKDLQAKVKDLYFDIRGLNSRITVQDSSLSEIQRSLAKKRDMIDNTPSIIPTSSFRITSRYGRRKHPVGGYWHFHKGLDLGGRRGDKIKATANGVVIFAKYWGNLGKCIKIKHKYGYSTLYAHLHTMDVKVGDFVTKGDVISTMGRTGKSTGIHLHYSVSHLGKTRNPLEYF